MLFKPGQLSLNLINGKKVDYIHPIRLYFIVSLIFFTLSSINNKNTGDSETGSFVQVNINDKNINSKIANESLDFYSIFNITDSTLVDTELINDAKKETVSLFKLSLIEIKKNSNITSEELFTKYNIEKSAFNRFVFNKANEYSEVKISDFFGIIKRKFNCIFIYAFFCSDFIVITL